MSNSTEIPESTTNLKTDEKEDSKNINQAESTATTNDIPSFGWSGYAERVNGRFAMIGLAAVLLIEALSKETFLHWSGFIN